MTNLDEYMPNQAERKLLEVLADPSHSGKSITDICKEAGISRQTYYEHMRKPEFRQLVNKVVLDSIKGKISDVLHATYQFAVTGAKNHQDRKILLEMAGVYKEKQQLEHTGANGEALVISTMSEEEKLALIKRVAERG